MNKLISIFIFLSVLLAACGAAPTSAPTATAPATATEIPTVTPTATPLPTVTLTPVPTLAYPSEGYGPSNFPADVDPLTGLKVANPALLERRPMLIKVANLPRFVRPQWGISLADIVFEYYTEKGTTRFAGIFYGNDADMVGPIRSGRFVDEHLVRGYKAVFAYGPSYVAEEMRFESTEFANRLVNYIQQEPGFPLFRYDPNGYDFLMAKTADLSAYATNNYMENTRQDLNGMLFKLDAPAAGQPGTQAIVRYSASIYNRWDYDPASGKYLRFSDTVDVIDDGQTEQYAPLTDRLTEKPIAFENVVFLFVPQEVYSTDSNGDSIYDIQLRGSGEARAFRDGQMYQVNWQRNDQDIVSLTNPDSTSFAFKPGTTWFELIGINSSVEQTDKSWRFTHFMP
jgi:hypothetical protein